MMFPAFGTAQALIQRKRDVKKTANTVFVLAPIVSLGIIILMFFLSPVFAWFYNAPALTNMLRILSVTLLFSATMPERIQEICKKYMSEPIRIEIQAEESTLEKITRNY